MLRIGLKALTCRSYLSHLGAMAGIESFFCCFLDITSPEMRVGSLSELRRSGFTFSCKLTVFSAEERSYKIKNGGSYQ